MSGADPVARLLAALENVTKNGSGYTARCPAHDDRHNSLKVDTGREGQALIFCHAGCEAAAVVGALGWTLADLYPPRADTVASNGHGRHNVATYDYRDADGSLLYQAVRFEPKGFAQRRPDGRGGWIWELGDVQRVLYRLPELQAADPAAWVLVPEGEKDVERLAALGFVATTNAGGAGKWRPEYCESLRGRRVVLLPDNDEPGEKHAATVARSLVDLAAEVRVVRLPHLPPKGDVSDWLDAGGTVEELQRLADAAEPVPDEPNTLRNASRVHFVTARQFAEQTPAETEWAVEPYVPAGGITKIDGAPKKAGKTTLITYMVAAVLNGSDFLGKPTKQGPVVLLTEQGGTSFREALARAGLLERDDLYLALFRDFASLDWLEVVRDAFALANEVGAVLLVVDTLPACSRVRGDDENSSGRALEALEPLQVGADQYGVGIVISFHDRKGGGEVGESGRGSSAYAGAVDIILHVNKPGGNLKPTVRKIEALSRFEATPDELYVELTGAGYVSLGNEDDVVSAAISRALVEILPDTEGAAKRIDNATEKDSETGQDRVTEQGILDVLAAQGLKVARSTLDLELKRWINEGYASQTGTGRKGSPHRYWLVAKPPDAFFRSKPSPPSEERILSDSTPTAGSPMESDAREPMVSSDALPPSEERNAEVVEDPARLPILSSDAPDGNVGRMQSVGVLTSNTQEWL
jgi:hypothetical protein